MKKLLLFAGLLAGSFAANAQLSCDSPLTITDGITNAPAVTGTFVANCFGDSKTENGGDLKALYYAYTPAANGELTITSDLETNVAPNSVNTGLSVFAGSACVIAEITCVAANDNVSEDNLLSTVTFPVTAGTTYYIIWDNYYSALKFDFSVSLDAISCMKLYPNDVFPLNFTTTTSTTISWRKAIGDPANYQYDWSNDLDAAAGTGTIVDVSAGEPTKAYVEAVVTGPEESSKFRYYVRSNCGSSQSLWAGPYYGNLAVPLSYSNDFDAETDPLDGFYSSTWKLGNQDGLSQSSPNFVASNTSTQNDTFSSLYTRAISLKYGENVTLEFYTALAGSSETPPTPATLQLYAVRDNLEEPIVIGSPITVPYGAYTKQTIEFTSPRTDIYYFVFNNETPMVASAGGLLLDTISMTSTLGVNEFLSSQFSVYPNPAKNVVTFRNGADALINTVEMTDLNGRVVKTVKVNAAEGQVSISDLANGIYMMRIATDKGVAVKKIVKE